MRCELRRPAICGPQGAACFGLLVTPHAHAGSGIHDVSAWRDKANFLAEMAQAFGTVRVLDLGGGLGVPERAGAKGLDLEAMAQVLTRIKRAHPQFEIWMEPGRFLVAEAGALLGFALVMLLLSLLRSAPVQPSSS